MTSLSKAKICTQHQGTDFEKTFTLLVLYGGAEEACIRCMFLTDLTTERKPATFRGSGEVPQDPSLGSGAPADNAF